MSGITWTVVADVVGDEMVICECGDVVRTSLSRVYGCLEEEIVLQNTERSRLHSDVIGNHDHLCGSAVDDMMILCGVRII